MVKYILCIVIVLLLLANLFIFLDFNKYIKSHENELVENHVKGLLVRAVAMAVISVCIAIITIWSKLVF